MQIHSAQLLYTEMSPSTKAAFCLTQKAALWYNLQSLAFLAIAGRGHNQGPAAPTTRLVPFSFFLLSPRLPSVRGGGYGLANLIIPCIVRKCNRSNVQPCNALEQISDRQISKKGAGGHLSGDHVHVCVDAALGRLGDGEGDGDGHRGASDDGRVLGDDAQPGSLHDGPYSPPVDQGILGQDRGPGTASRSYHRLALVGQTERPGSRVSWLSDQYKKSAGFLLRSFLLFLYPTGRKARSMLPNFRCNSQGGQAISRSSPSSPLMATSSWGLSPR